jgi:phage shock protein E
VNIHPLAAAALAVVAWIILKRFLLGGKASMSIVKQKIEAGAKIVDVRTADEYRDGGYPGAVNIPLSALPARMNEIPKDRPVVLYCASGGRSGMAARQLRQAGYADVTNAGGLGDMPR